MPKAVIKILGPYSEENNPELICEMCKEDKTEEALQLVAIGFESPKTEEGIAVAVMNLCDKCFKTIIKNGPVNMIQDVLPG